MNMSSKTKKCKNMEEAVKGLLNFASEEEKLDFEAEQLHLSIMFKVKELMDERAWTKSDLAKALGVGKPHITKLFSAEKFINIKMMAKIEQIFKVNFSINVFSKHALLNDYTRKSHSSVIPSIVAERCSYSHNSEYTPQCKKHPDKD
jgi:plasmid maintenance system antidote protein VapI